MTHRPKIDWHAYYQETLGVGQRVADIVTRASGTWTFIAAHGAWWGCWFTLQAFDPFPYNLLTMLLSLEAILLSTLVLMSQNRSAVRDRVAQEQRDHMQVEIERLIELNNDLTAQIHAVVVKPHAG